MKIAGFIAEFNPLHEGHKYFINQIKKDNPDLIVSAMSPNFTMRGEPAIFDKFYRTKKAIEAGVDFILEIPTIFTIQRADIYAKKGIEILNAFHITDLYFGVETDDINSLIELSNIESNDTYKEKLKEYLDKGFSFNTSYKKAIIEVDSKYESIIKEPNNLLAIQYIKMINLINPSINIHPIKRIESGYYEDYDSNKEIQSATAIRQLLSQSNGKNITHNPDDLSIHMKDDYFNLIKYRIMSSSLDELSSILGVNDGFEYELKKIDSVNNYSELANTLISKRNRETKVNRILMAILLNIKKTEATNDEIKYVRVLGFNNAKRDYLKTLKSSHVPFITTIKKGQDLALYQELEYTKIYYINKPDMDYTIEYKPIILCESNN